MFTVLFFFADLVINKKIKQIKTIHNTADVMVILFLLRILILTSYEYSNTYIFI